jgi:acyl-CoA thioester hydrolase
MARFYETRFGVYFDDLDMFGILHNARYLLFVERALGEFWTTIGLGPFASEAHPDHQHLVRANHIEYDRPMVGVGEVRVRIQARKIGRTSLIMGFKVMPRDEDLPLAQGWRVLVRIDPVTRTTLPWSDQLRALVTPYLDPNGGPDLPA